jgi:hypothetical protein
VVERYCRYEWCDFVSSGKSVVSFDDFDWFEFDGFD